MKTVRETGGSILSSAQQLSLSRDAVAMSVVDDHDETVSRNVICCLLALEIAEYDARPVFDQIRSTQDFRKLLADATANACPDDLVSIVHEDGALLSFLADPEQCIATALEIREAASTQDCYRDLPLRIGINLGMVEIAEDEFGHLYVSGQGRQDADRIMRHGPPRQISVARPFFELLSRVAPRLSGLLEYEGVFSDTLGPPLSLYRLPPPHGVRPDHRPVQVGASGSAPGALAPVAESTPVPPAESVQLPVTGRHWLRPAWLRNSLLPLLIGAVLLTPFSRSRVEVTAPGQAAGISAQEAAFVAAVVAPAPADTGEILEPAAESPKLPSTEPQTPLTSASKRIATSPRSLTQKAKATTKGVTKARSEPRAESATLVLAVKPWGEVYVDGKRVGITPPLKRFQVAPGRRQITVTNSSLPSYRMEATLNPAGQITVAHDFSCVSHREKPCRDEFGKGLELRSRFVAVSDENQR